MKDGIHMSPVAVRLLVLAGLGVVVAIGWSMLPEARRYLKMEMM